MALEEIRKDIDEIDKQLLALFLRRMECARRVAEVKKETGSPVFNEQREEEVLNSVAEKAGEFGGDARLLFSDLMASSRAEQHRMLGDGAPLRRAVTEAGTALEAPRTVACLGQKGSYSHEALLRLYPGAEPLFFPDFAAIFAAVESGSADLGVAPVENSLAGSVAEVYDLILKYRFSIVQALSLPIWHCLASSETELDAVKIVYSQPQALSQCSEFLKSHSLHTEPFSSTAEAALEARKPGVAAVCSHPAAAECGLHMLADGIQNNSANRTRFIAVSRSLVIPVNARKISLCFSVPHRTGTLSSVLSRFSAAGLNLTKIESRPIAGKNFEYDFYLDFTGNIRDRHTLDLLCALHDELPRFSFLGNYAEEE